MSRVVQTICGSVVAACLCAGSLPAQRYAASGLRAAAPAGIVVQRTGSNPRTTLFGGLATGDGEFDAGPALQASFNWNLANVPFNLRLDPYFAYHSADGPDASIWFLGASGNIEFTFETAGSSTVPYLFGGVGMYFSDFSVETPSGADFDDSGFDAGFGLGGGVRFGGLTLEAKIRDIDEFTTVAFMLGFMLGSR